MMSRKGGTNDEERKKGERERYRLGLHILKYTTDGLSLT